MILVWAKYPLGVGSNMNTEKSAVLFSRKQSLWKIILKGKHAMT